MIRLIGFVALAYVVARMLVVLALGDVFVYGEEHEKAFVSQLIAGGVDLPYSRLPYHPYEGGGFVASHVKIPFMALFGVTPMAHKAAAIAWGLLIVCVTMALASRHGRVECAHGEEPSEWSLAGSGAALFVGLALVLAPTFFVKSSLVHLGIHFEALLFIGLTLHFGLAAMATPKGERVPLRSLVALGLSAGFGTYFNYQVALAVAVVIGGLALRRWRTIFHPALMLATVVGLLPWICMWLAVGDEVFDLHGEEVGGDGTWLRFLASLKAGIARPLAPAALGLGAAATIAGWVFRFPTGARLRAIICLGAFVDIWILSAGFTGLVHVPGPDNWFPFLRFAPFVWALIVILGLSVGPALAAVGDMRARPSSKVTRLLAAIFLGAGAVHLARMVEEGDLASARSNWRTLTSIRASEPRNALTKIIPRILPEGGALSAQQLAQTIEPLVRFARDEPDEVERAFLLRETIEAAAHVTLGQLTHDPDALRKVLLDAWSRDGSVPSASDLRAIEIGLAPQHFAALAPDGNPRPVLEALGAPTVPPGAMEALGRYRFWPGVRATDVPVELDLVKGTAQAEAYLRGLGARAFRSGVMQPYFGAEVLFRRDVCARRLDDYGRGAALSEAERTALLDGFNEESRAFGFR